MGVNSDSSKKGMLSSENLPEELQRALIMAKEGDKIYLPEGSYSFQRSISLNDTPEFLSSVPERERPFCLFWIKSKELRGC